VLVAVSKGMLAVKHCTNEILLNWGCWLTQVDLYNGRKTVVLCVVDLNFVLSQFSHNIWQTVHHHHHIYSPQNTISTSIQESTGRLPERHKHPSMLAALTTKRYNTSTQMHKKHKKEEKHSQYTSRQQLMCRIKKSYVHNTQHKLC